MPDESIIDRYAEENASDTGTIGHHVTIVDAGYIKNVRIGDYCKIEGAGRLKNGSLNSNEQALFISAMEWYAMILLYQAAPMWKMELC